MACRFNNVWLCRAASALLAAMLLGSAANAVELMGYVPNYRIRVDNPLLPPEQDPFSSYVLNTLKPQMPMLDEVRYYGISVNANGTLTTSIADQQNIQKINDLKSQLPESQRPRLGITLGGAGLSSNFATIAANSVLRATLATNIKNLMDSVGATSVDVDWEHPSGATQVSNYALMMKRIKESVGVGGNVSATMTPVIFMPNSVFDAPNGIDGISLMTYDLGYFGNDPDNPHNREHSLPEYVEDSLNAWTSPPSPIPAKLDWFFTSWGNSTLPERLGIGLPFYGRNVNTEVAITYADLVSNGSTADGNYYDYPGQVDDIWIPGLDLVDERVEFANEHGLKNIIMWELGQDLLPSNANSMLRRAYEKNQSFLPIPGDYDGDRSVGQSDFLLWKETYGSTEGDMRADGNQDHVVDGLDYAFWRNAMGPSGPGGGGLAQVPEPTAFAIVLCAGGVVLIVSRNPRRSRSA